MTVKTRSQTMTTAQKTLRATQDIETIFRQIHRGEFVLVNASDLTDEHRILWWVIGIEEGVFKDDDIPPKDYPNVYRLITGK